MADFNWHSDPIDRETMVNETYRTTQNVRRFLRSQCGDDFRMDRCFMHWIKNDQSKSMGDVADEWLRRNR